MLARWLLCIVVVGGCGQVVGPAQCPAAQQCNGVCCAAGEGCNAGVCSACSATQSACNGSCLETSSDPMHCGGCDVVCDATSSCVSGACTACGAGMSACDNVCLDTQTDEQNCGACGKTCDPGVTCAGGRCIRGYYVLTGTPDPTTVFNAIEQSYRFGNNLTNSIWQRESNMILTGEFSQPGYWAFAPATATYAANPDHDTANGIHARMVLIPATNTVIYSNSPGSNGVGAATSSQFYVATMDPATGLLGTPAVAVLSDAFTSGCWLTSASATQFLCFDGTRIRRYTTAAGSPNLTFVDAVTLSQPLPTAAQCMPGTACYGSTFAFDGAYFYFAADEGNSTALNYVVYSLNGAYTATYAATGTGALNGVYFDWSVGRYSTHDGYGTRTATLTYGTGSDTHNFGAVSTTHTLE